MEKKDIIYAFIDSQNLNLGVKQCGWELDFKKFRIYLKEKYHVKKAFLFIGYIKKNVSLYKYLRHSGYIVVFKPVVKRNIHSSIKTKGNVDSELVMHCMIMYKNFTKAIIVSGDGDFYCLIEHLKTNDKLFKIFVPNRKYSSLLRKYAKYIVVVEYLRNLVE